MILAEELCAKIHADKQIEAIKVLPWRGGMLMTSRFVSPAATLVSAPARCLRYLSCPSLRPLFRLAKAFIAKARNLVCTSFLISIFMMVYSLEELLVASVLLWRLVERRANA
jgi:hypothetical protein